MSDRSDYCTKWSTAPPMCISPDPWYLRGISLCTVRWECSVCPPGTLWKADDFVATASNPNHLCVCPNGHRQKFSVRFDLCDPDVCQVGDRVPCCKAHPNVGHSDPLVWDGCTSEEEAP